MKTIANIIVLSCWLSAVPVFAQDFLLQGTYGNAQDSAVTANWIKKYKEQAADLAFRGFTYAWLPRATALQQAPFADLIKTLQQAGIQPIMDLTIPTESAIFQLMPLSEQLRNDFKIKSFRITSKTEPKPVIISNFLNEYYSSTLNPALIFTNLLEYQTPAKLADWVSKVRENLPQEIRAEIQPRVYDYPLREALQRACEDASYDVRTIYTSSVRDVTSLIGYNVVTGINNDDFLSKNKLIGQPLLAYAYLLTNNQIGLPEIFYGDYYGKESGYDALKEKAPLKTEIDQLIKVHQTFIYNATEIEYLNSLDTDKKSFYQSAAAGADASRALIFQLDGTNTIAGQAGKGHRDVIVAINFANKPLKVIQEINTSNVTSGAIFTDILGRSASTTLKVEANTLYNIPNAIMIELPARSYSIWVQGEAPPVTPSPFALQAQALDDFVELTWEVPSEKEVKGYEVEKSVNSSNFIKIAWIEALGEAGAAYLYTDEARFREDEVAYRIKALYKNGAFFYSSLQEIKLVLQGISFEMIEGVKSGIKTIKFKSNQSEAGRVAVFNAEGKEVMQFTHVIKKGVSLAQLDLTALPKGVYLVNISSKNKNWTKKIVNK